MATLTRKSEKTIATVSASYRKIAVSVPERLTISESKELRALLKEQEKLAAGQSSSDYWDGLQAKLSNYYCGTVGARL